MLFTPYLYYAHYIIIKSNLITLQNICALVQNGKDLILHYAVYTGSLDIIQNSRYFMTLQHNVHVNTVCMLYGYFVNIKKIDFLCKPFDVNLLF